MNVLISINKQFINPAKLMLFSLQKNCNEKIDLYVMNNNLTKNEISELFDYLRKKCRMNPIELKIDLDQLKNMPIKSSGGQYFGIEAYNRLFCQYYLNENIDRILYLDADIVIDGDLKELYNCNFENNYYVACKDFAGIENGDSTRLNLKENFSYMNSGVLLINLELLRNIKLESLIELIDKYKDNIIYPDQDLLNLMYENKIKDISSKYNYIVKDERYTEINEKDINNISVYHYAGKNKPWKINGGKIKLKYLKPYYRYLFSQCKYFKLIYLCIFQFIYKIMFIAKNILKKREIK